jgi:(p)ppGpp synthase/HD superfamily hydrolase
MFWGCVQTIVAAILLPAPVSLEELEPAFGSEVIRIIHGYMKMLSTEDFLATKDYAKR